MKASQIVALDDFALQAARGLAARQPRCDNTIPQLPTTTPVLTDIAVISRPQAIPGGGFDYGVSLLQLQQLIGGGGGIPNITFNTNFSPLTIYNYGNSVVTPAAGAAANTSALQTMFNAMQGAPGIGGGLAWIPQYNFPVNASSTGGVQVLGTSGGGNPGGIIVQGLGGGGQSGSNKAFNFSINDTTVAGTFLTVMGAHTSGGQHFLNLGFQWNAPNSAYFMDTCVSVAAWNTTFQECTFTDCPVAVNFTGLAGSMTRCTINYAASSGFTGPANTTSIIVAGQQTEISGPSEFNGNTQGTTGACILIGGGTANSNHTTLRNLHIYGWNYGLDYQDINGTGTGSGAQNSVVDGCHFECFKTCVNVKPLSSSGQIFNQAFSNNLITKGQNSTNGAAIFLIDSNGGASTNIDHISLVNNLIYSDVTSAGGHTGVAQSGQYGLQIGTCQTVNITGGQISQVGTVAGSDGTANICISGVADSVIATGVNLNAYFYGSNGGSSTGSSGSNSSQYALLVSGDPVYVQVDNCSMIGFAGTPVSVTGSPGAVYVTNCVGYNDQNTVINLIANITTGVAYEAATQGANSGTSYFGPSFVMFTANSSGGTFQVNGGTAQTLLASQVVCLTLVSPYDTIQFNTHAPSAIMWVGK